MTVNTLVPAVLGLTSAEVAVEQRAGRVNVQPTRTSRTYADIVRANVLTRFNALITLLVVVVLAVGHPLDALFGLVMVGNTTIGIVQEVRAKRTLDRLRVLTAATVTARRDGTEVEIDPSELVNGDVIELAVGDQVPIDGVVLDTLGFDVDESALTGEADAVAKQRGDAVRAGSAAVAGSATILTTAVGPDTWIHDLLEQAKRFELSASELRRGVDRILQWIGWLIVPVAALLLWSQLGDDDTTNSEALVATVAGVVGLIPQGLVLLVSMALAVAIVRLARNHVVVQELHAVEGLARVDVLCLDKTGTLTTGAMRRDRIMVLGGDDTSGDDEIEVGAALAALAALESPRSATLAAAAYGFADPGWIVTRRVPFSSQRKWSAANFVGHGSWIVGAPELLVAPHDPAAPTVTDAVAELAADARRVVLVMRAPSTLADDQTGGEPQLPLDRTPVALVVLAEELRADAADTMRYFADQHVAIKVISGDNPATVSTVAQRLGIAGAERYVDLHDIELGDADEALLERLDSTMVFGRVLPHQKRQLVEILQQRGHTVAMTGDGVNDIPALKRADIGIAMDTATPATKAVSQLILLDGRFDRLPAVVAEGRRVITNMERVSALFVTKTTYSVLLAAVIGLWGVPFPLRPRHVSLVSELTIGLPAFALSFRPADRPYRPGYLRRVMRFAAPAGVLIAVTVALAYGVARRVGDASLGEQRTATTLVLLVVATWTLVVLVIPIDRFDFTVLAGVVGLTTLVVAVPFTRRLYAIDWPTPDVLTAVGVSTAAAVVAASAAVALARRR